MGRRLARSKTLWLAAAVAPILAVILIATGGASQHQGHQGHQGTPEATAEAHEPAMAPESGVATAAFRVTRGSTAAPWLEPAGSSQDRAFSPHRASFSLSFRNQVSPYNLMSVFLLPGEDLELGVADPAGRRFTAEAQEGELSPAGEARWRWQAPAEPGRYMLRVSDTARGGDTVTLNAFVKVPYDGSEYLNGYRIGSYAPGTDARNAPPRGFIEVTPENRDTWVSPHFRLEQFLCKQESGYPKYLLVQEPLLLKLQRILEEVNERGIETQTFAVMSSFRTPFYNRAIGNTTIYSRHLFGDAADIYVDRTGNGWMDDLTGTGVVDEGDARVLFDLVEDLHQEDGQFHLAFNGGMGLYRPRPGVHPPFIHVDTRGHHARW